MNLPNKLSISYQFEELPAPHSYIKEFTLTKSKNNYKVSYELDYTGRDGISLEEIEDEGFSENDNESWVGVVSNIWVEAFLEIIQGKPNTKPYTINFIDIKIDDKTYAVKGFENEIDYYIQELTQALYEIGGAENPLEIKYAFTKNNKSYTRIIKLSFAERKVNVLDNTKIVGSISWKNMPSFLELIYLMDFNEGYRHTKLPKESAASIDPGDGFWYKMEMLKKTISKSQFEKLNSLLVKYIEESAN
jgi:hypothetical protein